MLIYEDNYIIAVNKPNNFLVHHSKMANNVITEVSLVALIKAKYDLKVYPIHRLDRKTSGVIICAKKREFVSKFQNLFKDNTIQKVYYSIVRGFSPISGTIDTDVKGRDSEVYKTALTHYVTKATKELEIAVTPYNTSRYSLIVLQPKTGRLHQLRIHLNKINHPLIGDPKYGDRFHNRMFKREFNCDKLFLHARSITFVHPYTNEVLTVTAKFPTDWFVIFKRFNWSV
jgi:tRNA pseudouridine65 synthase